MTIAAPNFFDLMRGRVTPGEWVGDFFRNLENPADEIAHHRSRENLDEGDAWNEMAADLHEIHMELVDFQKADKSKRGSRKGSRRWSQIDGDIHHQTASFVDDVERCVNIPADVLITPTAVGIAHPPTAYLYAQHSGNRRFNSVETACRAAGIEGDARTFWRNGKERRANRDPKDLWREPTDKQLQAGFIVTRYHGRLNALHGHPHTLYGFHRNTHRSRVSDMGSKGALYLGPRFRNELGLAPIAKLGSGKRTPEAWGGQAGVAYSWKVKR